jgi:hypothetical protein
LGHKQAFGVGADADYLKESHIASDRARDLVKGLLYLRAPFRRIVFAVMSPDAVMVERRQN